MGAPPNPVVFPDSNTHNVGPLGQRLGYRIERHVAFKEIIVDFTSAVHDGSNASVLPDAAE